MRTVRRFLLLALVPLLVMLGACGDDDGDDTSSTTVAGSQTTGAQEGDDGDDEGGERKIVLYSGRDEELIQPLVDAFTEETGIEVEVRYGNSAEMAAQILEEGESSPADVFYSQEVGAVGALAKAGLLGDLPEDVLEPVDERFRPASGTQWVGITARSRVIVYNPEALAAAGAEVPEGVLDLADPQYEGLVAIVPGNAGFQAFVTGFRVQKGEDAAREWLQAMIDNGADTSYESNGDVLEAVNNGDIPIGLINHYYWARHENRDSLTAQLIFPKGDDPGGLVNATAAAILKGAVGNEDAVAFIEYLLSETGQQKFVEETWEYPVIDGVPDPEGIPPLEELEGPPLDLTDLDSLEETQALLTELGLLS
jgi:iron(III) transport system substrate-binding protein